MRAWTAQDYYLARNRARQAWQQRAQQLCLALEDDPAGAVATGLGSSSSAEPHRDPSVSRGRAAQSYPDAAGASALDTTSNGRGHTLPSMHGPARRRSL